VRFARFGMLVSHIAATRIRRLSRARRVAQGDEGRTLDLTVPLVHRLNEMVALSTSQIFPNTVKPGGSMRRSFGDQSDEHRARPLADGRSEKARTGSGRRSASYCSTAVAWLEPGRHQFR
jgi:hypothetical protein